VAERFTWNMSTARPGRRSALYAQLMDVTGGRCEWPGCPERADEMAHLHSIGMGGRASADELLNVAALCFEHARASDGEVPASHGARWYRAEHERLWAAVEWDRTPNMNDPQLAYERAEALRAWVHRTRGWAA